MKLDREFAQVPVGGMFRAPERGGDDILWVKISSGLAQAYGTKSRYHFYSDEPVTFCPKIGLADGIYSHVTFA